LGDRSRSNEALLLVTASHTRIILLVLRILILSLRFFLTVQHSKPLLELVILHAELSANRDESAEAVDVVLVLLVDLLVDLQRLVEQVHAAVATCDHQLPFDLLRLDLGSSLEVLDGLLKHILLGVVHTKARNDINLARVVAITLLVKVHRLELILLLLVKVAHLGQNLRIRRHLRDQDVVPFESLTAHADQLINVSDLVKNLVAIRDNSVELLESLERLVIVAEALIDQAQVVYRLDAVSLNTDSLQEEFLGAIELLIHEKGVALVDEGFGVVAIVLDGEIGEMLSILEIVFQEVQERDIVRSHCHHYLVFLLEALEALDSFLDFLVFDKVDGFCDLHLRFDLGKVGSLQRLDDVVVAAEDIFLDERCDKLGGLAHVVKSLFLLLLQVLLERVQLADLLLLVFILELEEFLLFLLIHAWDIDQEEALEPRTHFLLVAQGVQAHDQVEADVEIGSIVHDVLIHFDSLTKALLFDQGQADIFFNFQLHLLVLLSGGVDRHIVVFNGHIILLLLEIDVAHVHTQARRLRVLLVLQNNRVTVDGFGVEAVSMVHVGEVVEDVESQVDVDLVQAARLLTQRPYFFLLCRCLLRLLERFIVVFGDFGGGRNLQKTVYFLLELLQLLFLTLFLLLFNVWLSDVGGSGALREGLALEASACIGLHGGAEALRRTRHVSARAHPLVRRGRWLSTDTLEVVRVRDVHCL